MILIYLARPISLRTAAAVAAALAAASSSLAEVMFTVPPGSSVIFGCKLLKLVHPFMSRRFREKFPSSTRTVLYKGPAATALAFISSLHADADIG